MSAEKPGSPYTKFWTYRHVVFLAALLAVIGWAGLREGADESRLATWLLILALMALFMVLAGHGITGLWRGILIDSRNRMSLSRLQLLAWTLVVLSAILTAALTNTSLGSDAPLEIEIPTQLWVLMGISTGSMVGASAILGNKRDKKPEPQELERTIGELKRQGYTAVDDRPHSLLIRNTDPRAARWGDLLKGEEAGNAATVDLGKMQMFFFSFILVVSYATAIAAGFEGTGLVSTLPAVEDGMNTLLGISHTGYLANKTVSHTREAPPSGGTPG